MFAFPKACFISVGSPLPLPAGAFTMIALVASDFTFDRIPSFLAAGAPTKSEPGQALGFRKGEKASEGDDDDGATARHGWWSPLFSPVPQKRIKVILEVQPRMVAAAGCLFIVN
jgi:hypothetical protein